MSYQKDRKMSELGKKGGDANAERIRKLKAERMRLDGKIFCPHCGRGMSDLKGERGR